jgi:hypothetical protein
MEIASAGVCDVVLSVLPLDLADDGGQYAAGADPL